MAVEVVEKNLSDDEVEDNSFSSLVRMVVKK